MIEGSARARTERALASRSTISAGVLDLRLHEEVDFFRLPSTKDVSGWFGPAVVTDISGVSRGQVVVKFMRNYYNVALRHIRRHLVFHVFLNAGNMSHHPCQRSALTDVLTTVGTFAKGTSMHVGPMTTNGKWQASSFRETGPLRAHMLSAVRFLGENLLCLGAVTAARLSKGVAHLPSMHGCIRSVTMIWFPRWNEYKFIEHDCDSHGRLQGINLQKLFPDNWDQVHSVRLYLDHEEPDPHAADDEVAEQEQLHPQDSHPRDPSVCDQLSTIHEEDEPPESPREDTRTTLLSMFFEHEEPEIQSYLDSVLLSSEEVSSPLHNDTSPDSDYV